MVMSREHITLYFPVSLQPSHQNEMSALYASATPTLNLYVSYIPYPHFYKTCQETTVRASVSTLVSAKPLNIFDKISKVLAAIFVSTKPGI